MKAKAILCIFIALLFVTAVSAVNPSSQQLFIDSSINLDRENAYIFINVLGKVFDNEGNPVQNAEISVQVNDPHDSSVYVAFIHSDQNGGYHDAFTLGSDSPTGEYRVYLTAGKPGFDDGYAELSFRITAPRFHIVIKPLYVAVDQGETATYNILVEANSNISIYLTITGLPEHSEYDISPNPVLGGNEAKLTIITFSDTPSNTFNLTIIGSSNSEIKHEKITLAVQPANKNLFQYASLALIVIAASSIAVFIRHHKKRRKKELPQQPTKRYYVEGLPIDSETLMQMPDHIRKTALTLCNLREATAEDISQRTGRARAVESDYLNQLVNLGHIKKKRKGRKAYFYV